MQIKYSFINYLIESSINESYKDARRVFIQNDVDDATVDQTLNKFKSLVDAHKIQPEDKDITKWMKRPFKELYNFVTKTESTPSNKEVKRSHKKNAIPLKTFGDWIAIIPLTTEASCYYGKGTQWCTAANKSDNYFDNYFNNNEVLLIYFINKNTGEKYALATQPDREYMECFDERDNHINFSELARELGISNKVLDEIVQTGLAHSAVPIARDNKKLQKIIDRADDFLHHANDIHYANIQSGNIFDFFLRIENFIDHTPNLEPIIGKDKFHKLNVVKNELHKKYKNELHKKYIMDQVALVKHKVLDAQELLNKNIDNIYSRGNLRAIARKIEWMDKDYTKYASPEDVKLFQNTLRKIEEFLADTDNT